MKKCKKLPIGNSSFEIIRQDDLLYVDKTRYIFKMADEGMYYFMSRPHQWDESGSKRNGPDPSGSIFRKP